MVPPMSTVSEKSEYMEYSAAGSALSRSLKSRGITDSGFLGPGGSRMSRDLGGSAAGNESQFLRSEFGPRPNYSSSQIGVGSSVTITNAMPLEDTEALLNRPHSQVDVNSVYGARRVSSRMPYSPSGGDKKFSMAMTESNDRLVV